MQGKLNAYSLNCDEMTTLDQNSIKRQSMTNNDIFKKLRVALKLRDDEIVKILELVDFRISKSELGAFSEKKTILNMWNAATKFYVTF